MKDEMRWWHYSYPQSISISSRSDLPLAVALDATDGDQMCRSLRDGIRNYVFQLADLVSAICERTIGIFVLDPELGPFVLSGVEHAAQVAHGLDGRRMWIHQLRARNVCERLWQPDTLVRH